MARADPPIIAQHGMRSPRASMSDRRCHSTTPHWSGVPDKLSLTRRGAAKDRTYSADSVFTSAPRSRTLSPSRSSVGTYLWGE